MKKSLRDNVLTVASSFFEIALGAVKPSFMKLFIVLVFSTILIIVLFSDDLSGLEAISAIIIVVILVIHGTLAIYYIDYLRSKSRYDQEVKELLKKGLRELVLKQKIEEKKRKNTLGG